MPTPLGGSGQRLPLPQYLYPSELYNAPYDVSNNLMGLAPGTQLPIPAGTWYVSAGQYSVLQFWDPVINTWRIDRAGCAGRSGPHFVRSDGFNWRIANLTGCPVSAVVQVGGSGYAESTTTVTSSAGGSTWTAIVGGQVSLSTISNAGRGYGVAPLLFIPAPPSPGVQATGICTLTSGTVSGITLTNVGAGYDSAPTVQVLPNPTDPNINSGITQATVVLTTVGGTSSSGSITAVICTNPGASVGTAPTLTVAGAGTSASVVAQLMQTMTGATIFGGGTGITTTAIFTTVGGRPSTTPQWTNPDIELTTFLARPAQALLANSGGSLVSVSAIYDGGLFVGTPNVLVEPQSGSVGATGPSVGILLGGANDQIWLQPC